MCMTLIPLCTVQTPWRQVPETRFRLKIEKGQKNMILDPRKGVVVIFSSYCPFSPLPIPLNPEKVGVKWGVGGPD